MRQFSLERYAEALDRQVVHMDQGVCYCPEFRSTHSMSDYPSRKLQLARAVYTGELTANDSVGTTLLNSILSRQGERWQSFGETPEEYTDCMLLARELMLHNGINTQTAARLREIIQSHDTHILDISGARHVWQAAFDEANNASSSLKDAASSSTAILVDDATCLYAAEAAPALAQFLFEKQYRFRPELEFSYDGWEFFVYGLIDEGIEYVRSLLTGLQSAGISRLITLSGRSEYLFQVFYPKLGLTHELECLSVLDTTSRMQLDRPSYLYAGSFRTRYLGQSKNINALTPNTYETPHPASEESEPLLNADRRVNTVTLRQKPLRAEHLLLEYREINAQAIFQDALEYIRLSPLQQIVVMEPWAYHELKKHAPTERLVYYLETLD